MNGLPPRGTYARNMLELQVAVRRLWRVIRAEPWWVAFAIGAWVGWGLALFVTAP